MALRDTGRQVTILVARLCLAAIFLYSGYQNLFQIQDTAATLADKGYPAATVLALVAVAAKLLGGAAVALGAYTSLGCLALILFLVPATYSFHLLSALASARAGARAGDFMQTAQTLENLGLIAGLLLLWILGPGAASVDRLVRKKVGRG
jgi:putative oxidoreductase